MVHQIKTLLFASLSDLYDELQWEDIEHVDVSVVHDDSGWAMSAYGSGRLIFEHLGEGGECHMIPVSKERVLELWRLLAAGYRYAHQRALAFRIRVNDAA